MTEEQKNKGIALIKATALNKIIKIYHPKSDIKYSHYEEEGSYAEQRDGMVSSVLWKMNYDLKAIKINFNKKKQTQK